MPDYESPIDRNPALRRHLYDVQWLVNGAVLVLAFVLTSLGESPLWFVIGSGALSVLWTYLGLTARRNVQEPVDLLPPDPQ